MVDFDVWRKAWLVHAETAGFRKRIGQAVLVCRNAASRGRLFLSTSGGKDSTAMAGICYEAGVKIPLVQARTILDFPGCDAICEDLADRLGADLLAVEPADLAPHVRRIAAHYGATMPAEPQYGFDQWDVLRAIPSDVDIIDLPPKLWTCLSCNHMLVSFMYDHDYDGSFIGRRADESRMRRTYARVWGAEHQSAVDKKWSICPILALSSMDVFAYITSRGLPLHPFYERACRFAGEEDPGRLRVGVALPPGGPAARGAVQIFAQCFPVEFRRLAGVRPELRRYVV